MAFVGRAGRLFQGPGREKGSSVFAPEGRRAKLSLFSGGYGGHVTHPSGLGHIICSLLTPLRP